MTNQEATKILTLFRDKYAAENGLTGVVLHAIDTLLSKTKQPDWATAPEKANFYAEDENGIAHWYKYRPSMGVAQWVTWGDKWGAINSNWKTSIQQRPKNQDQ